MTLVLPVSHFGANYKSGGHLSLKIVSKSLIRSFRKFTEYPSLYYSQADFYEVLMCKLMSSTSEDPSTIPRPSNQMVQDIYQDVLRTQLYHFQDCAGRAMRDCRVFRTSQHFLQTLYNAASIATNLV